MKPKLAAAFLLGLCLITAPGASRAVFIDFIFSDAPGTGFNDPVLGPARMSALRFAGDRFGGFFEGFPGQRTTVDVSFRALVTPTVMGVAEAFPVNAIVRTGDPALPRLAVPAPLFEFQQGRQFNPPPAKIHFNPVRTFSTGLPPGTFTGVGPTGTPDFATVAMHELGHIFGFSSNLNPDGTYSRAPTVFDTAIGDTNRNLLVFLTPEERLAAAASSAGNTAFWFGRGGVAANGGVPPNLSAAAPFRPGTNLWHLSSTFFPGDVLLDTVIETVIHDLHPVERGMYEDLGWILTPLQEPGRVVEPDALALCILALIALAYIRRERGVC